MDVAIAAIEDSSADFYGFCRSAIQAKFFDHGRSKTGMSLWVKPSPGRKEAVEKLFDTLEKNDKVQFENFVVNILENSFTSTYLEPQKPIPKYVDNHCFGCADKEVWCILSNKSLCLSKFDCLEKQALPTKFAIDTEIVRVSILMLSDKDFVTVTEDFKNVMRQQIADQLFCSKELLTKVNMVESEDGKFELGFDITLRDDNTELKKLVILLQRIVDLEQLEIITTEAYFIAVSESLMFQQFISGYPKPRKDEGVSSYFWNAVVGGSFFALLILVFTLLVKAGRKLHNRPVYQTPDVNAENHKTVEKASKRRPEIQSFLKRK
ncbi:uncharacterized protein LOC123537590 [Mercenaria mercenaria]|uniref:uncharacterized protein LOC123537590 n=1 Tax=Mercenaria mercenaria TaxID=6596 RepID=UPI00234F93AD|nr:uncharacterized protein LOC123537590 [Mercenaria mercenaria]